MPNLLLIKQSTQYSLLGQINTITITSAFAKKRNAPETTACRICPPVPLQRTTNIIWVKRVFTLLTSLTWIFLRRDGAFTLQVHGSTRGRCFLCFFSFFAPAAQLARLFWELRSFAWIDPSRSCSLDQAIRVSFFFQIYSM